VQLRPDVAKVLLAYRSAKWNGDDLVFPSKREMRRPLKNGEKKFLRSYEVRDAYHRVQEAAGLPQLNFHEARHSFNSWLLNSNKSPFLAKELLGHKTMKMTTETYGHAEQEALQDAVASLRIECLEEQEMPDPVGEA
jgi:integrase